MDHYGYRGTVAILSAISLHGLLAMITLQPVEWHMRKVPISSVELSCTSPTQSQLLIPISLITKAVPFFLGFSSAPTR